MKVDLDLLRRFRFFHEHGGYIVGMRAVCAMALARAEIAGEKANLAVRFAEEEEDWDGDCPAPNHVLYGFVVDETDESRLPLGLGMIGVDSFADPYLRVVSAELIAEALPHVRPGRPGVRCEDSLAPA